MPDYSPPWPKAGPASYFPSIEKKYGRSIADWQVIIADCGLDKHMAIVNHLKTCLLYTSPSPRDRTRSRMPSSA